jgi:hypothetical protein
VRFDDSCAHRSESSSCYDWVGSSLDGSQTCHTGWSHISYSGTVDNWISVFAWTGISVGGWSAEGSWSRSLVGDYVAGSESGHEVCVCLVAHLNFQVIYYSC